MHGLINRSIECFLRDTYGVPAWRKIAADAHVQGDDFEAMLRYDDQVTFDLLSVAAGHLAKPVDALLEDLGAYLVSLEPLRRLLRFGGVGYDDFLMSLPDLHGRAQMAVPDLNLPQLDLRSYGAGRFTLICRAPHPGFGHVFMGVLRAMADDYGALALIDHEGRSGPVETVRIALLETQYHIGRRFELARPSGI